MPCPPRSSLTRPRRAAAVVIVAALLVGALSTTAVADEDPGPTGTPETSTTSGLTPPLAPVPASPESGEGVVDPGPTTPAPDGPGEPVRVLLEGDSMTQGFNGDYTWRYRLAQEVQRQKASIDFVGSKHLPNVAAGYATSVYAGGTFDSDHFATVGSLLSQHAGWIRKEASEQRPDVVVLAAGVNDLRHETAPQQVNRSLQAWIANLRAVAPHVKILLSPVLPAIDSARPWLPARTQEYNALLRQTAAAQSTATSPIRVADTSRGWSAFNHTVEGLHPNPTGETVIAQRIAEALKEMGVLGPVSKFAAYTRWERGLKASVALARGRATLRWDRQSLNSVRILVRAPGESERLLPSSYYQGTATVPIPEGGRYTFRLVAVRQRLTSTPGPLRAVWVPWSLGLPPAAVGKVRVTSSKVTWSTSPHATVYLVSTRRAGSPAWRTVRTAAHSLGGGHVVAAKVWALNPAGRSASRSAHR